MLYQEIVIQFSHDKKCRLRNDFPFLNGARLYSSHRPEHMRPALMGKGEQKMDKEKLDKEKTYISLIMLIAVLGVFALIHLETGKNLHRMMDNVNMPAGAELVLPQKTRIFACCGGSRLGIEEVYRIPADQARSISYGEKDRVVVEPFEYSCELNGLYIGLNGYEHDCSYVYDYGDVMDLAGYRDDDGYLYVHVWGREHLGGEDSGVLLYGLSLLSLYAFPAAVVILVLKFLIDKMKKKREDGE